MDENNEKKNVISDESIEERTVVPTVQKARKRGSAARASKALFRAIDILFDVSQNNCPYVKKKDIKNISVAKDVVYYSELPETCIMDIYRVEDNTLQPAIILIHGGGFSAGDKKYRRAQAQYYAINGFTVFCVNYGLSPQFIFPEPLNHLVIAANYIFDNAQCYNIDKSRIFTVGDSAGAYYAAVLDAYNCTRVFEERFGQKLKFKICGSVLNCGLYDLDVVLNTEFLFKLDEGVFTNFIGMTREEIDSYEYKDVCMPYDFVNDKFPPSFLIFTDADLFCKGQSDSFIKKLNEVGAYTEFYKARHATSIHCFSLNWRGEDALLANALSLSFLKRRAADAIKCPSTERAE